MFWLLVVVVAVAFVVAYKAAKLFVATANYSLMGKAINNGM